MSTPQELGLRLEYVREPDVSAYLDQELRVLLSACFTQPHDAFFKDRRYANELPLHRHMLRTSQGALVAHVGAHEKMISVDGREIMVGGIAEVCVHPTHRRGGLAKYLLGLTHDELARRGIEHAMLFGEPELYLSSGYRPIESPVRRLNPKTKTFDTRVDPLALARPLGAARWPTGPVDLKGPEF